MPTSLNLRQFHNIVVLTGAGVSVASGLRPFRGPGGVWEEFDVEECGHVDALERCPDKLWVLVGALRQALASAKPNTAHIALAAAEASLRPGQNFLLVTQNVDGLHERAGSLRTGELHGNVMRTRCSNPACDLPMFLDGDSHRGRTPLCPRCGRVLRPDIVLFGEYVDVRVGHDAKRALRDCDLFLAIGTSGLVEPASGFVRSARYSGARTVLVNLEPTGAEGGHFDEVFLGRCEELLPSLLGVSVA